jgi:hypothetical protein
MFAGMALLLVGCSTAPCVTSPARGKLMAVSWYQPVRTSLVIGTYERPVATRFWLFAEQSIDFHWYTPNGPAPCDEESESYILLSSSDLRVVAYANGLPVGFHAGRLLVGTHDYGPIAEGDTIEFTASGIVVAGRDAGPVPES